MANESDTDLLMRFILPGDVTVWAECAMKIAETDTLIKDDFYASDDLHEYTNYFQIDDFSFDLELSETDGGGGGGGTARGGASGGRGGASAGSGGGGGTGASGTPFLLSDGFLAGTRHHQGGATTGQRAAGTTPAAAASVGGTAASDKRAAGAFASWRSAEDKDIETIAKSFNPSFKTVSFSKVIDAASPNIFEACVNAQKFEKVIIAKRISQGLSEDVDMPSVAYIRFDFSDVMVTSVSWNDGDLVKEKITFESSSIKVRYRKQLDDGTVSESGETQIEYKRPQATTA